MKDKRPLEDARKRIENEMGRFKVTGSSRDKIHEEAAGTGLSLIGKISLLNLMSETRPRQKLIQFCFLHLSISTRMTTCRRMGMQHATMSTPVGLREGLEDEGLQQRRAVQSPGQHALFHFFPPKILRIV